MIPLPEWNPCPAPTVSRRQLQQQGRSDAGASKSAATSPLLARAGATATAVGRFVYFIGGRTGDDFHSDVFRFDTSSLAWARGFDPCPSPRSHHVAFHVEGEQGGGAESGGSIWVLGGHDASDVLSSVLAFDLESLRWRELSPRLRGRPELLVRMAAAAAPATAPHAKGCFVVHGGVAPAAASAASDAGGGGTAAGQEGTGTAGNAASSPRADTWLSDLVLVDPKRMLVERIEVAGPKGGVGGVGGGGGVGNSTGVGDNNAAAAAAQNGGNEVAALSPSPLPPPPFLPPPRAYHSLTSVSGRLVVFGGRLPDNSLAKGDDLGCIFDPIRKEWTRLSDAVAVVPRPRLLLPPVRAAQARAVAAALPARAASAASAAAAAPARPRASHRAACVGDRVLIFGGVGQEEEEEEHEGEGEEGRARAAVAAMVAAEGTATPAAPRKRAAKPGARQLLNDVVSLVFASDGTCSWSRDDDPSFAAAAVARAARSAGSAAAAGATTAKKRKEPAAAEPPLLLQRRTPSPLQRAAHAMVLVHGSLLFVAGGYGERERGGRERGRGDGGAAAAAAAAAQKASSSSSSSSSYPSDMWRLGPLPSTAALARSSLKGTEDRARRRARDAERARQERDRKERQAAEAQNGVWRTTKRGRAVPPPPKFAQQQPNALPFVNTAAAPPPESPGYRGSATGAHSPGAARTATPARDPREPPRPRRRDDGEPRQLPRNLLDVRAPPPPPSSSSTALLTAALRDKDLALERAAAAEQRAREANERAARAETQAAADAARAAAEASARRDAERSAVERERALNSFKELERALREAVTAKEQAECAAEAERQRRLSAEAEAASAVGLLKQQLAAAVERGEVAAAAAATAARRAVDEAKQGRAEALASARASETARAALQQELAAERQRGAADAAEAARRLAAAARERDAALQEARAAREAEARNAAAARGHVSKLEEAEDALRARDRAVAALSGENRRLAARLAAAADAAAAAAREWGALVRAHGPTFGALAHLGSDVEAPSPVQQHRQRGGVGG